jgi:hypothetical protein
MKPSTIFFFFIKNFAINIFYFEIIVKLLILIILKSNNFIILAYL